MPPRPRLFGHERHERREQPQQRRQRASERERGRPAAGFARARRTRVPSPARRSCRRTARRNVRCVRARVRSRSRRTRSVASSTTASSTASIERSSVSERCAAIVERRVALGCGAARREHELRHVEDLRRELAPDLELVLVERGVGSGPRRRGPVTHPVGAVLLEPLHRRDDVALRLRHLLAVGIEHPTGDRGVRPREHAVLEMRAQQPSRTTTYG